MNHLTDQYGWLEAPQVRQMDMDNTIMVSQSLSQAYVSLKNEEDKVVVYERAGLLFAFNFHPTKSFTDYRVGVDDAGEYGIVLSSDEGRFGGFDNIALDGKFFTTPMEWNGRRNWIQVCFWNQYCTITPLIYKNIDIYAD
jgi:1,4-alpha-glucan branching enzyme